MSTNRLQSQTTRRVLIADDDPTLLQLVTNILKREGYTPVVACDGREAFRILQSDCDFVAAIFDADMPHLLGSDLVNHMRTERRLLRIPVMIMSASEGLLKNNALSSGVAVFLPKPFTSDQLRVMLRMLEGSRLAAPKLSAA
ncbi:MAG TPA: response regulator [Pyrinomonadaceae bacterium]|jgi:CheY-like chemotaxis protein|nr:response regulator [Pyrinomonadaceae bacterium]